MTDSTWQELASFLIDWIESSIIHRLRHNNAATVLLNLSTAMLLAMLNYLNAPSIKDYAWCQSGKGFYPF